MATAEVVPLALTCLWHRLRDAGLQSYLVNTVHDSIIAEVHPEEKEIYEELAKKALTTDAKRVMMSLYNYEIKIPLNADIEFRSHWGESKDWKERYLV
jgi:DNA polymerase I-like protein with 3'-5' exonuclease and polymerase domains